MGPTPNAERVTSNNGGRLGRKGSRLEPVTLDDFLGGLVALAALEQPAVNRGHLVQGSEAAGDPRRLRVGRLLLAQFRDRSRNWTASPPSRGPRSGWEIHNTPPSPRSGSGLRPIVRGRGQLKVLRKPARALVAGNVAG